MRTFLASSILAASTLTMPAAEKKIISFGWEFQKASPAQILANSDRFKALGINGVGISLRTRDDKGDSSTFRRQIVNGPKYQMSDFAYLMDDLRKIANTPHLKHSFILGYRAPLKRLAWTDDEAWGVAAHNMALIGRIARETGLKGICCDHEDYYKQHQYEPAEGEPPFDELCKIARRRGREVFGALFRELPDARVLFYWFLTFEKDYFTVTNPEALVKSKRDLWPAFADGILDALPKSAIIIDGDEHAYNSDYLTRDFHVSACNQRLLAPKLVSPENREKHRRQVQVGFGLYLDMYVTPAGSYWYSPPINGSRAEHFRRNLADAVFLADEYVWLWGERHVSAHYQGYDLQERVKGKDTTWDEAMPGFAAALVSVRDNDGGRKRAAAEAEGKPKPDLNPNPACTPSENRNLPRPYHTWKPSKNTECVFALDRSVGDGDSTSVSMQGGRGGCISVESPVSAVGDLYEVSVRAKYTGQKPQARITWRLDGRWVPGRPSISICFSEPDRSGWCTGKALYTIPPGTDAMTVILGTERNQKPGDKIWFDNIHIWRIR